MTNTPTTYTNDLLALLLALQSPTTGTLAEDSKKKLKKLGTKLAVEPDDGEDIEGRLKTILQGNPDLKREHEKFLAQLANLTSEILQSLLPTKEERDAVSSSKVPITFGPIPSPPDRGQENPEGRNVAMVKTAETAEVAFKHENPAEASKTLLQRVLKRFGNQGK